MELTLSLVLLILLVVACLNYLTRIALERVKPQLYADPGAFLQKEGFTGSKDPAVFLENKDLYDNFYASVYDQLTQNVTRTHAKIALLMHEWQGQGSKPDTMIVLDAGAGTGVGSIALAKMNVSKTIAIDLSPHMIKRAKEITIVQATLTDKQKASIDLRQADLMNPSALGGGEVTDAVALYFTIYYMPDIEAFFRNMFLWVKPGGHLAVEVVNKHKFDPMLESASPWLGFSLQKYSKDRITESKVVFDKFDYTGKFELHDPSAEFRETFRFKDGTVRRQRHRFQMPSIEEIVKIAKYAGWTYTKYVDLTAIGFEYSFLLQFRHP